MYPSEQKPYSDLFVVNQVNAVKEYLSNKDILDFYYMERTFSNRLGSVVKYVKYFLNFIKFVIRKRTKYDIVHVCFYYPTVYLTLLYMFLFNTKSKILVAFHGFDLYRPKKNLFFNYPLKFVDLCIGVSKKMCERIAQYYHGKIENISATINLVFEVNVSVQMSFDLIYVDVGPFHEVIGFDRLCRLLDEYGHSLSVCVIGSGPLENCLYEIMGSSKYQVLLLNDLAQSEIVDYLNQSKVFINLSREESLGLNIAEVMACGLLVIAIRIDGSQEQITNHVNGVMLV